MFFWNKLRKLNSGLSLCFIAEEGSDVEYWLVAILNIASMMQLQSKKVQSLQ